MTFQTLQTKNDKHKICSNQYVDTSWILHIPHDKHGLHLWWMEREVIDVMGIKPDLYSITNQQLSKIITGFWTYDSSHVSYFYCPAISIDKSHNIRPATGDKFATCTLLDHGNLILVHHLLKVKLQKRWKLDGWNEHHINLTWFMLPHTVIKETWYKHDQGESWIVYYRNKNL
jgi:hypothetical protein